MTADHLVVFLKAPRLGTVKTRLAVDLGQDAALHAYCDMVGVLLEGVSGIAGVELRHTPDDAGAEVSRWLQPGWTLAAQGGGGLGERLNSAVEQHFASGAGKVVVIGADCPEITPNDVNAAFAALDGHDLVLGPAEDGGYWLIGVRATQPGLFEAMPWSTDQVLAETRRRADGLGLKTALLRPLADLDTVTEWRAWQGRRTR